MTPAELFSKELTYAEINDYLSELMGYSCNIPSDSSEPFIVFDEDGDKFDFRRHIGMKALNTLSGILLFKEKLDVERGEWRGRDAVRRSIKQALGISQ